MDAASRAGATRYWSSAAPALLCLIVVLGSASTRAHLPEYFGRLYVLENQNPDPAEAQRCGGDREALREAVVRRQRDLEEQQVSEGAYSAAAVEDIGELGNLYSQLCNHPAALDEYRRLVHLLRISDGLLTRAQLPYLRAESEHYRDIGDFESAQKAWRYAFRIHGMGRETLDTGALSDSLGYFSNARAFFIDPRSSGDTELFFEAYRDNEAMFEAQRLLGELGFKDLQELALSHLANLYLVLGTDLSGAHYGDGVKPSVASLRRLQDVGYFRGKALLEWLMDSAEDQSADVHAQLALRLGNWYQWNGKWRRACEYYARAWHFGGEESAVRRRLARPAELPEDAALWSSLQRPELPLRGIVVADFYVSARGDVSRLKASTTGEESSALASRLSRWLRDSHARPAVVDGECIGAELRGRHFRILQ